MTAAASSSTSQSPKTITVGVLALQGAFIEHIHYIERLRPRDHKVRAIPIRNADELATCDALIIPGGESTVIHSVAERTPGLLPALQAFVRDASKPVWGTCAGMILMAAEDGIGGGKVIKGRPPQKGWGGIEGLKVWRNLYGTQLESFEAHMTIPCLSNPTRPFNAIFIRAPAVHSLTSTDLEVLAQLPDECKPSLPPSDTVMGPANDEDLGKVMIRQGTKLVTSFHPELSGDERIHEYWLNKLQLVQTGSERPGASLVIVMPSSSVMGSSRSRRLIPTTVSGKKIYLELSSDSDEYDDTNPPTNLTASSSSKRRKIELSPDTSENEVGDLEQGSQDGDEAEEDEEEYEIDYIVNSRYRVERGKKHLEYYVHWLNYSKDDRSWTDAAQFDDDDPPVIDFYARFPNKPGHPKKPVKPATPSKSPVASRSRPPTPSSMRSTPAKQAKRIEFRRAPVGTGDRLPTAGTSAQKASEGRLKPIAPGDLRSFFSRIDNDDNDKAKEEKDTKGKGKARDVEPKSSPPSRGKKDVPLQKPERRQSLERPRAAVKKPKGVVESEVSDFEMEDSFVASEDDSEDDEFVSAEEGSEDFEESEPEDDFVGGKSTKRSASSGVKSKPAKRPPVKLGHYKTGIKPLPSSVDAKGAVKGISEDLPPMSDVELMFDHLVSRVPDIVELVKQLNGRKLRVATMCSGTESPLLALNMIAKAIKAQHGLTLSFDHVFSCEIEPFKQAYIERNFSPPILFRDVTELGKKRAHTAYGSVMPVPGNVDILIAGTSCVDYSNLNNQQQDIDANGESGRTFRGMLQWVKKHQPPIVILENVCSAPWDKVVEYFAEIDYDAQHQRFDTKEYYIPHTRTRVYLFATPRKAGESSANLPEKWVAQVKDMRRPWSSSFEAFLLQTDDQHIHRARLELASAKDQRDGTSRKPTDWNRCESRHQRARLEEQLGLLRPLTSWKEAGVCKGLDWTWNDWLSTQTERVLDLLEISTLRMAKDGVDSGFKACIWNVSQNVDRQTGSGRTALAPCLTPNMIPWVTSRGGPVTGREALALQGIPVRDLLLTSESEDQLADLAGNAMTTTVVGASMLAALRVALNRLTPGQDAEADAAQDEEDQAEADAEVSSRVVGEKALEKNDLDLAKVDTANLRDMLDLAERSCRHCQCEGRTGTAGLIAECEACGYRACRSCGGRPDHQYRPCKNVRLEPTEFEKRFKELLPMRVQVAGLDDQSLSSLRQVAASMGKGRVEDRDWTLWSKAVIRGVHDAEFRFRYLKRGFTWTAVYEAPHATLDLVLEKNTPEWRLTIKSPVDEPVNSRLRSLLLHPIARLRFDVDGHDVLCGPWEICVPSSQSFQVEIKGQGELVPSWHATLGLGGQFEKTTRWSKLEVTLPDEAAQALDRDLSGTYTLLPKCGQAMSSLHKKEVSAGDDGLAPLFLFLDPSRYGESDDDSYVFSTSTERLDFGTERAVIATLSPKWRESSKAHQTVRLDVRGGWVTCKSAHLTAVGGSDIAVVPSNTAKKRSGKERDAATYAVPVSAQSVSANLDNAGCTHATALLSCRVPLNPAHSESMWRKGKWGEVDLQHHGNATFANLAWITERLPQLDVLKSWTRLPDVDAAGTACQRCAPRAPKIHWMRREGKKNKLGHKTKATIFAFEDKSEAGRYEHALKNRPAAFVVQLRLDNDVGRFRIGLNIVSLAHRALARLPQSSGKGQIKLSWRLTPGQVADVPRAPRVFVIPSNKADPQHAQPRGFQVPLRKEQLRSLWWMLDQERAAGKTHTFVEEEISEAALPAIGWRAEGKAERPVMVRGGVIADQVGYGKTIISLALIAETKDDPAPEPCPTGYIDIKATLIVVPGHLSRQWPSEIERFTGTTFKTIVIQNKQDLANKTVADLSKADIIVMACELFEADSYWERFEYVSAQPEDWLGDKVGGRFFVDRLETAMSALRSQVEALVRNGDSQGALANMAKLQEEAVRNAEGKRDVHKTANFGKRMKGQAYRDRYEADPKKKKKSAKAAAEEVDLWEASESEDEDVEEIEHIPVPKFRKCSGTESYGGAAARKDFKLLSCPVLHMFRFRRIVADEFTYLDKRGLAALQRLSSSYKWILSGTPPVGDFPAIRSIAAFLGIHLGVEDDAEGSPQAQKARAKEQTAAEKFHAFREVHSAAWHDRRDDLAQEFLNIFVRQNIAEIDDIPTAEHIHEIRLPAAECAVYLELEHHLQALEMQARKETKLKDITQGDRNARLEEALADSKTAEEALLKRCCHFTLDLTDKKRDARSAQEACQHISNARRAQLTGCEADLERSINAAVGYHTHIRRKGYFGKSDDKRQHFKEWIEFCFDTTKHQGDKEAADRLIAVLKRCGFKDGGIFPSEPVNGKMPKIPVKDQKIEDVKWKLREDTHLLRKLSKELVARVRSLRFFDVVRKLQKNGKEAADTLEASACQHKPSTHPDVDMAVLSCCGHVACHDCMVKSADEQKCVKGDDCHAAVRFTNIVKVQSLGIEGELSSGRFGAKLRQLVGLIQKIPTKERILVFLQWEDLAGKVSEALTSGGIEHLTLSGAVKTRAATLDKFQTSTGSERVLLLKVNDASAAGSNLTNANHAIFIGPLFTNSLYNYRATETQAIGRIRRYGQTRDVHVHRLLAVDTIDTSIFSARRGEESQKSDYMAIPQSTYVGKQPRKRESGAEIEIISPIRKKVKRVQEPIEID